MQIPSAIHHTWRDAEVPTEWRSWHGSWRHHHPGWRHTLWTDDDCRALVGDTRPELLPLYDAYPTAIQRADAFRYVLLEAEGGLYVDLDFECRRPLGALLDRSQVVLGLEPAEHVDDDGVRSRGLEQIVCNAFMASPPSHPFWQHVVDGLLAADPHGPVLDTTGVFLLTRAVASYAEPSQLHLVPSRLLYPISKHEVCEGGESEPDVRARVEAAVAVHHWASSWQRDRLAEAARQLAGARRARRPR